MDSEILNTVVEISAWPLLKSNRNYELRIIQGDTKKYHGAKFNNSSCVDGICTKFGLNIPKGLLNMCTKYQINR